MLPPGSARSCASTPGPTASSPLCAHQGVHEVAVAQQVLMLTLTVHPTLGRNANQPLPCAHLAVAAAAGACEPKLRGCASVLPALPACAPVPSGSMPGMVESSTCTDKEALHTRGSLKRTKSTCSQIKLSMRDEASKSRQEQLRLTARYLNLPHVQLLRKANCPRETNESPYLETTCSTQPGTTKNRQGPLQAPRYYMKPNSCSPLARSLNTQHLLCQRSMHADA